MPTDTLKTSRTIPFFLDIVKPRGLYRPDIDGLRAVAVLAVCVYHFSPKNFPGGFIGVDVFFVISGYLITGILAKAIVENKFNSFGELLSDFYQRRIRRIFPALIMVLAFCTVAGWLVLFSSEYQRLGKHIAAGAGYIQNFILWAEAGYFDHDAMYKPLLHLWSLAVEEQFYIVWPFVLWFVMRRRWPLMSAIALIAGVSFLLNISLVLNNHTMHAFYFPTTRTWELMTGACLAIAHRRELPINTRWTGLQAWLGLALVALGFILITPSSDFPGFWALLPVGGTALMINAGPRGLLNGYILSWRPAVAIGLISYTLYLWHWVLLSFAITVFGLGDAALRHQYKLILPFVSLLLAWLTYRFFEQPVRHSRKISTSVALCLVVAVLGAAGLAIYVGSGFKDRPLSLVSSAAEQYMETMKAAPQALSNDCFNPQTKLSVVTKEGGQYLPEHWYCAFGDTNSNAVIMAYGDSHARSMIAALDQYGRANDTKILFASIGSCLPLIGVGVQVTNYPRACEAMGQRVPELATRQKPQAVILVESWTSYMHTGAIHSTPVPDALATIVRSEHSGDGQATGVEVLRAGLANTLSYYQSQSIPVLILEDNPHQTGSVPKAAIRFDDNPTDAKLNQDAITLSRHKHHQAAVNELLEDVASHFSLADVLNTDKALCDAGVCPWARNGQLLYSDSGHLSAAGSELVYPLLEETLNGMLTSDTSSD